MESSICMNTRLIPSIDYDCFTDESKKTYDIGRFYAGELVFDEYDEELIGKLVKNGAVYLKDHRTSNLYNKRTVLVLFYKLNDGSFLSLLDGKKYDDKSCGVKCNNLIPIEKILPPYCNVNRKITIDELFRIFTYLFHGKKGIEISNIKRDISKFYYGNLALASYEVDKNGNINGLNGIYHLPFEKYSNEPAITLFNKFSDNSGICYNIYDALFYGVNYCVNNGQYYSQNLNDTVDSIDDSTGFNIIPLEDALERYHIKYLDRYVSVNDALKYYKKINKKKNAY